MELAICLFLGAWSTSSVIALTIDDVLRSKTYPPPTYRNRSLHVKLGIYLESLGNFRSTDMTFDTDIYVYMSWQDIRLKHNQRNYVMVNDDSIKQKLWVPDLYFANARQAFFQKVTRPNFNMFIAHDGQIAYSLRCTLTVACTLDLRYYPMDQQVCAIKMLSYAHIAREVNVTWFEENAISLNPRIGLPEFRITHIEGNYCNGTYRYALMPGRYKIDKFSCLSGKIYLKRSLGYNILNSYIPTGLIVMISWVSFWIDRRAVPARVTLSFTTLVSFTTLGSGLRFGLAQVSYAKALDIWYGVCLLFVFLALVEFAIINNLMRKSEKKDILSKKLNEKIKKQARSELIRKATVIELEKRRISVAPARNSADDAIATEEYDKFLRKRGAPDGLIDAEMVARVQEEVRHHSRKALALDKSCRVWFPMTFILFNAFYWWYYLVYRSKEHPQTLDL